MKKQISRLILDIHPVKETHIVTNFGHSFLDVLFYKTLNFMTSCGNPFLGILFYQRIILPLILDIHFGTSWLIIQIISWLIFEYPFRDIVFDRKGWFETNFGHPFRGILFYKRKCNVGTSCGHPFRDIRSYTKSRLVSDIHFGTSDFIKKSTSVSGHPLKKTFVTNFGHPFQNIPFNHKNIHMDTFVTSCGHPFWNILFINMWLSILGYLRFIHKLRLTKNGWRSWWN